MLPARACTALFRSATLLLACTPLLGMRPAVLVVMLWVLSALLHRIAVKEERRAPDLRTFLLLSSPFLLMVFDLLRADDIAAAWTIAERSSFLAIAPLVVFVLRPPVDDRLRDRAADMFSLSALALALFANASIAITGIAANIPFAQAYRAGFAEVTGIHPPFAAFFLLLGALFQLHRMLGRAPASAWRIGIGGALVLSGALIASRTPLVAFTCSALVLLWMHLPHQRAIRLSGVLLLVAVLLVLVVPSARQRVLEPFRTELSIPAPGASNSVSERFVIGHCSWALLRSNWLFGLGQSEVQPSMDACYAQFNDPRYLDGSYSTHQQALHWWLSFGVLGLSVFLMLFGRPLYNAIVDHDARLASFLAFALICCMTENVLARQWGVVPFAFFLSLFTRGLFAGVRSPRKRSQR